MRNTFFIFAMALITGLLSCTDEAPQGPEQDNSAAALTAFLDSTFDAAVARDPEWQSRLGIRTNYGRWSDISDAAKEAEIDMRSKEVAAMKARFTYEKLPPEAQLSYRLFEEKVRYMVEGKPFLQYDYPVNQMHGVHAETISFLINIHRIDSLPDAQAYIARLRGLEERMGALTDKLRTRAELGIIPPRFVFAHVISDCKNILKGQPFDDSEAESTLLNDFKQKLDKVEGIGERQKADLVQEATDALKTAVEPGYMHLINYLKELEAQADDRDGAWKFPDGGAFYNFALQRTTTTSKTAEEIHATGLAEVERIHGEMRAIMQKVTYGGELKDFFEFMRTDPQFYYPNTEEGKQQYLDQAVAIIDTMRTRLDQLFITQPKADLIVKPVEAYREKSAGKAFYNQPAPDGSRPGTYYANLYNMADMPKYQMEALAYHEAIPGHHMQLSIAMELDGVPKFRKYDTYTAYVEGWALYTEWIPREMGFYADPYSDFGRLAMELWRACRLVVDTGIHFKKWTREEAIDYLKKNTPNPEGDIVKAIERYIVMPSQATAYKIGMLKIQELRQKAKDKLGDRFDVRDFHEVVLTNGAVPLNILEELVDAWIAKKAA